MGISVGLLPSHLARECHRVLPHVRQFTHDLAMRLRSFLDCFIGHFQRRSTVKRSIR